MMSIVGNSKHLQWFFFYLYILMSRAFIPHFLHLRAWFSSHLRNGAALIHIICINKTSYEIQKLIQTLVLYIILSVFINSTYTLQKCFQPKFIQARSSLLWVMTNHSLRTCYFKNIFESVFCYYFSEKK